MGSEEGLGGLEPFHRALYLLSQRRSEEAAEWAGKALERKALDEAAWLLKTRALTEPFYVDEAENEEEGLAESLLDDGPMASLPRPGTSLVGPPTGGAQRQAPSPAVQPRSASGRPVSGFVRPGSSAARGGTSEGALGTALRAPRTAKTARPVTSSSGRFLRLGTASMLSQPGGPFINVSRLNLSKYAAKPSFAKPLFEYLFFHENDVRNALQLASLATQAANFKDWHWKVAIGKCYYRLGMWRDAERQLKSARDEEAPSVDVALLLGKVYLRLDQPLSAMEEYKRGLDLFPDCAALLTGLARVHEGVGDLAVSVQAYRKVLGVEATSVEAIASIATHYFYSDQPEVALRFYRRLLQMGVSGPQLYTNLGLCCFYAQQWDLAVGCVEKALELMETESAGELWYNVGHMALGGGDVGLAYQCFRLALAHSPDHGEALTNLAVLELRAGRLTSAKSLLKSAMLLASYSFEPFYNYALISFRTGHYQASFTALTSALQLFPDHADSLELKRRLDKLFSDI